ncbi:lipopolysaccharide biosynthesis protein [Shewanella baltica]|uniref:lipopolysaccharide biosynthesis protein n=1 Tax=Shewanella baltica TaxID=62322 RepID=UPI003D08D843
MFRKSLVYSFCMLLPQFIGFILLPVYSRYLSKTDFSYLSLIEIFVTLFSILGILSVDRSVIRFLSVNSDFFSFYLKFFKKIAFCVPWFWCFLFFCVYYLFTDLEIWGISLKWILLGSVVGVFRASIQVQIRLIQYQDRINSYIFVSIFRSLLDLVFIYAMFNVFNDFSGPIVGMFLASFSTFILCTYIVEKFTSDAVTYDKTLARDLVKYTLPILPTVLLAWLLMFFSRASLEYYNLSSLADFSMSYKISYIIAIFSVAMQISISKSFYSFLEVGNMESAQKILIKALILISFVCFFLSLSSWLFLDSILGNSYEGIWVHVLILNLSMYINGVVGMSMGLVLYYYGRTVLSLYLYICYTILSTSLLFFLIFYDFISVNSVAFVLLISSLFLFLIQYLVIRQYKVINNGFYFVFIIFITAYMGVLCLFINF